jgi:methyltransferase (TIGR00027 family)
MEVQTKAVFTGRMCAGSRYEESTRQDSLFYDPLAQHLAGEGGLSNPMGSWILVPRTRYGDDMCRKFQERFGRGSSSATCPANAGTGAGAATCSATWQLVLMGAGMDARAYRLSELKDAAVFEVDLPDNFQVKEPLLQEAARKFPPDISGLKCNHRAVVGTEFGDKPPNSTALPQWGQKMIEIGFNKNLPTLWLLEGLMYYLDVEDQKILMSAVGQLSPAGSAIFHDAVTPVMLRGGIVVGGCPFIGSFDDYEEEWRRYASFAESDDNKELSRIHGVGETQVDRTNRRLFYPEGRGLAGPGKTRGKNAAIFVELWK